MAYIDKYGVEFSDDRKTLVNCPRDFKGEYIIPDSVTSIGEVAFCNCTKLISVTIGNSVTNIGEFAFSLCSCLTSIKIPNSVTNIGDKAFYGCSSLTSVTIPKSVTCIGLGAFYDCYSLTSVTLNSSAIVSKNYATPLINGFGIKDIFDTFVTEFIIGHEITSIGDYAFYDCSSLISVTIPNSVTNIEKDAFSCCKVKYINFIGTLENWCNKAWEPSLISSQYKLLINGVFQENVKIPNNVTSIGSWAFSSCISLASMTIGNSVTSIEDHAFESCSGLTSVTIPNSVTSIGGEAFSGCSSLTSVTIPNSVTSIGNSAFYNCRSLTSVTIPNSVTSIGWGAFFGCSSLTSVTIPNSVTSIESYAFYGCTSLTSFEIPNSVTSIGEYAFSNCTKLTSVTIPNSVTSIGRLAFCKCSSLISVTIPNSVTSIGDYAFKKCISLTSVTIPNSVTSIGWGAFANCNGLTSPVYNAYVFAFMPTVYSGAYTIPDGIESIVGYAFESCSGLTSVTIPNSVTSIGYWAFNECDNLTGIFVPIGQKERFAKMTDKKHLIVEKADVALNDRFTIRKLLYNNKITCFYHFTSRKNIVSICQHGGLYSWHYLKAHQIDIPLQGGGELSQGLDRYKGVADYVHLSFCENHPMAYHLIQEGEDIVVLKISTDVALLDGTMFTDMNAVDSQCNCAVGLDGLQKVNFAATKEKYLSSDNPLFKYKQAEILVKTHIPLEYILNIDEFL